LIQWQIAPALKSPDPVPFGLTMVACWSETEIPQNGVVAERKSRPTGLRGASLFFKSFYLSLSNHFWFRQIYWIADITDLFRLDLEQKSSFMVGN